MSTCESHVGIFFNPNPTIAPSQLGTSISAFSTVKPLPIKTGNFVAFLISLNSFKLVGSPVLDPLATKASAQ